jgi:hypothetical protein
MSRRNALDDLSHAAAAPMRTTLCAPAAALLSSPSVGSAAWPSTNLGRRSNREQTLAAIGLLLPLAAGRCAAGSPSAGAGLPAELRFVKFLKLRRAPLPHVIDRAEPTPCGRPPAGAVYGCCFSSRDFAGVGRECLQFAKSAVHERERDGHTCRPLGTFMIS